MTFAGHSEEIWAIHCDDVATLPDRLRAMQSASRGGVRVSSADPSIAVIPITGVLTKGGNWWTGEGSTAGIRSALATAVADPNVKAILLHVDSPGGSVMGAADTAAAIAEANKEKPVVAYVEDMAASGAMWLASQAGRIYANQPTAFVGSIGTYAVLHDLSGLAAKEGVKVHVVRAGDFKGMGEPGTEITAEHLAEVQNRINALNESFLQAVAAGRGMSLESVRKIATGQLFLAPQALELGLIDGIKSFSAVVGELVAASKPPVKPAAKGVRMSQEIEGPKAATIQELKAACPGAPADWVISQLEAGATVQSAQTAFIAHQNEQLAKAKKDAEEAAKAKPAKQPQGYAPVRRDSHDDAEASAETGDPKTDFDAAVRAEIAAKGVSRMQAVQNVARRNPTLHKAYLLATNPRAVAGSIEERFAGAR